MEAFVRPHRKDGRDDRSRKAETAHAERDVDPIRPAKRFDERTRIAAIAGELVVLEDHRRNLRRPLGAPRPTKVRLRQSDGRRKIVEGAVASRYPGRETRRRARFFRGIRGPATIGRRKSSAPGTHGSCTQRNRGPAPPSGSAAPHRRCRRPSGAPSWSTRASGCATRSRVFPLRRGGGPRQRRSRRPPPSRPDREGNAPAPRTP